MKKLIILAFVCLVASNIFAQSSTVGRDFWVSSTLVCSPDEHKNKPATPYIAVSAERACTVHIQGGLNGAINITQQVAAGSWNQFGNVTTAQTIPTAGPIMVPMNAADWYPVNMTDPSQVRTLAGVTRDYGLHITATDDVSVYVILSSPNSMDASNILPMTALQYEYYLQDYSPVVKSDHNNTVSMATILATENGTQVEITPHGNTYDGHLDGVPYTITLNKGQTYYVMSEVLQQIGGTHIVAKNDKKIAVFSGVPLTNLPTNIAARDCLFEQAMPVDYWGTQFIVTRSLWKNGNLIGITAAQDGTIIKVDGRVQATINAGATYYIMLQSATNLPQDKSAGTGYVDQVISSDVAYIETSCPCAVYSYDTGNSYKGRDSGSNEVQDSKGDPSSVWISPIQQKINTITFGTCYTDKTKDHFLNAIAETATCQSTTLVAVRGATRIDKSNLLIWTPVPGNPAYSYARIQLGNANTADFSVFNLSNPSGIIAHVYGNGEDESYAYSVGSAAVKRGVQVGGEILKDSTISSTTYCLGQPIHFNAQVGADIIESANWDLGDGVTMSDGQIAFDYTYDSPGWYDITATIMARKICPDTLYPAEQIHISLRVVVPDTIRKNAYICEGETYTYGGRTYTEATTDTVYFDCDSVCIFHLEVGQHSESEINVTAQDVFDWHGQQYYRSGDYTWTGVNAAGCDSIVTAHVRVVTCLQIEVGEPDSVICADETDFRIPYTHTRGDIGKAWLENRGVRIPILPAATDDAFVIPLRGFTADHYTNAKVIIEDTVCQRTLEFPVSFDVLYPSTVFNQKWYNALCLYTKDYNGGYDFIAYQWYQNGQPIPGATHANLTVDSLDIESLYQVELVRRDENTGELIVLMTCPYQPEDRRPKPAEVSVQPTVLAPGEHISIQTEGQADATIFSAVGSRESAVRFENEATMQAPTRPGIYLVQILLQDGQKQTRQILVK